MDEMALTLKAAENDNPVAWINTRCHACGNTPSRIVMAFPDFRSSEPARDDEIDCVAWPCACGANNLFPLLKAVKPS